MDSCRLLENLPKHTLYHSRDELPTITDEDLVELGRQALSIEIDGLRAQLPRLGAEFARACRICLNCRGRIVVTGMGKSGHIGGKIAATLASTGTPAFFVHPGEASHGDVGMITRDDAVLALSNSGETDEILTILPVIKRLGVPLIAFTGNADSALARIATVHLDIGVPAEACPLNLAPTASTTAALAVGDALAVALLEGARLHRGRLRALASGRHLGAAPAAAREGRDAHRRARARGASRHAARRRA